MPLMASRRTHRALPYSRALPLSSNETPSSEAFLNQSLVGLRAHGHPSEVKADTPIVRGINDGAMDVMIRLFGGTQSAKANVGPRYLFIDVDEDTYRAWDEPLVYRAQTENDPHEPHRALA